MRRYDTFHELNLSVNIDEVRTCLVSLCKLTSIDIIACTISEFCYFCRVYKSTRHL